MAEVVSSDDLSFDTGADKSWSNGLFEQAIRTEWFGSIQPNGREQEIAIAFVERLALPVEQRFQDEGMKRNRSARAFRLRISKWIGRQVSLAGPPGNCPRVQATQELGGLLGIQEARARLVHVFSKSSVLLTMAIRADLPESADQSSC